MLVGRLKDLSSEDRFRIRQLWQLQALLVGYDLFYALFVYALWDMPPGTKGAVFWYLCAAVLPLQLASQVGIGFWSIGEARKILRPRARLLLSAAGLYGSDLCDKPIPWTEVKRVAAFSNRPRSVMRRRQHETSEGSEDDRIFILQLSEAAWRSGDIRDHHLRMRPSLIKTFGIDGLQINPGHYGRQPNKLLSEINTLKARFG